MASDRLTKTNIDRDLNDYIAVLAAAAGISATQMLERIVLFYIMHGGVAPRTGPRVVLTAPKPPKK